MRFNNFTILEGRLTRDPEYKQSRAGKSMLKFSIANNSGSKKENKDNVGYYDVFAWSELAERFNDRLKKGKGIRVIGKLNQWRWKDDDGKSFSKISIVASHIEFLFPDKIPKIL